MKAAPPIRAVYQQAPAGVRFDWGPVAAHGLAAPGSCLVVVDVLSFTTSVSVAVARGTRVLPYPWRDASAAGHAVRHDAKLAVGRSEMTVAHPWSLSPAALLAAPAPERLVLPSPNGSTICAASGGDVVTASLRNASAVAEWLLQSGFGTSDRPAVVIAAGERWQSDDSLRPCFEDLLGAGALIAPLLASGCSASVEASMAARSFTSVLPSLPDVLQDCASGRELIEDGYPADVDVASELDADRVVPLRVDGSFVDALASGDQRVKGRRG